MFTEMKKGQNKRVAETENRAVETLTMDLGDLNTSDSPFRRVIPDRSINFEELRASNQRRVTQGGTPGSMITSSQTPSTNNKKQKTTFEFFVDQELAALASDEYITSEFVKHVGKSLRKRWQTMSKEEMKIYVDLHRASITTSDINSTTAASSSTYGAASEQADSEEEGPLKLSPELQDALRSFMAKPGGIQKKTTRNGAKPSNNEGIVAPTSSATTAGTAAGVGSNASSSCTI
jgi:hypothetical protein